MRDKETMRKRRALFLLAAAVSFATFAVYLRSLQNDLLAWDDNSYVIDNVHIRSLNASFFRWAFFDFYAANWHPLTWISHALDYAVWGLNPLGHHLTNVVLHGVNTFLVVLLVQGLLDAWRERSSAAGTPSFLDGQGSLIAAGATGVLFGLHPVHVESVAWVAERKDLLCGLFFLLSVMSYLRFAGTAGESGAEGWAARFRRRGYLSSLGLFILALMSKPMAVSLPLVLLLLDWHPLRRISSRPAFRSALIEKLPFIILSIAASVLTISAQHAAGAIAPLHELPLAARLTVAVQALMLYLGNLIAPLDLLPMYPYPEDLSFLSSRFAASLMLSGGISAASLAVVKRMQLPAALWFYFLITLLPVIGIVQVGEQAMADRYTYLPGLGPFLALGVLAAWAWNRAGSPTRGKYAVQGAGAALAIILIAALSQGTVKQIGRWESSLVLWNYVIDTAPRGIPLAYNNRGLALQEQGMHERAMKDFDAAIALDPAFSPAYNNRGKALRETGRIEEALENYSAAIALDPAFAAAYNNRGVAFMMTGRIEQAIADFDRAIRLQPSYGNAYTNRGKAYGALGRFERALADHAAALRTDPWSADAHMDRGTVLGATGRLDEAIEEFTVAIRLDPSGVEAYFNRGLAYARMNRIDQALADMGEVLSLRPSWGEAYAVRGDLYLKSGDPDRAAQDFQRACDRGNPDGCKALRELNRRKPS